MTASVRHISVSNIDHVTETSLPLESVSYDYTQAGNPEMKIKKQYDWSDHLVCVRLLSLYEKKVLSAQCTSQGHACVGANLWKFVSGFIVQQQL